MKSANLKNIQDLTDDELVAEVTSALTSRDKNLIFSLIIEAAVLVVIALQLSNRSAPLGDSFFWLLVVSLGASANRQRATIEKFAEYIRRTSGHGAKTFPVPVESLLPSGIGRATLTKISLIELAIIILALLYRRYG